MLKMRIVKILLVATSGIAIAALFAANSLAQPATTSTDNGHHVVLTFTKWITGLGVNGDPLMAGVVGGDVSGTFSGEVLFNKKSNTGDMTSLIAVYEVQAGDHSFKALVQGGSDNDPSANNALLEGAVLGGWLSGEKVHVQFKTLQCNPVRPDALGNTCFQGTITITPN
jgi:hypothetical protein